MEAGYPPGTFWGLRLKAGCSVTFDRVPCSLHIVKATVRSDIEDFAQQLLFKLGEDPDNEVELCSFPSKSSDGCRKPSEIDLTLKKDQSVTFRLKGDEPRRGCIAVDLFGFYLGEEDKAQPQGNLVTKQELEQRLARMEAGLISKMTEIQASVLQAQTKPQERVLTSN